MPTVFCAEYSGPEFVMPSADVCVLYAYAENIKIHEEYFLRYLSDTEREKSATFVHIQDRLAFIGAHALVRIGCGSCTATPPDSFSLLYMPSGKPFLKSPAAGQHANVSLSHCRAAVAAAFSRLGDVGVDIEQVSWFADYNALARTYFHPEEAEGLRTIVPGAGIRDFFLCWTKKEAFLKATGEGLHRELKTFLVPGGNRGFVRRADGALFDQAWQVESFSLENHVVMAVAYEG